MSPTVQAVIVVSISTGLNSANGLIRVSFNNFAVETAQELSTYSVMSPKGIVAVISVNVMTKFDLRETEGDEHPSLFP